MDLKKYLLVILVLTFTFLKGQAQNSVSVTSRSITTFEMTAILASGDHIESVVDNTQWLNYSHNWHYVAIPSGTIPPGMEIYIQADKYQGPGWSWLAGQPTGKIKLGNIPIVLIDGIGDFDTSKGKNRGHRLTLTILIVNYALVNTGSYTLNLQYTLSQ
jgi:hypothetical protein